VDYKIGFSPNPLSTPIGQMMQLKSWIQELQSMVELDPETGFLANLQNYVRVP